MKKTKELLTEDTIKNILKKDEKSQTNLSDNEKFLDEKEIEKLLSLYEDEENSSSKKDIPKKGSK